MKNAQKALLVIAGMAALAACSLFDVNSTQKSNTSATIIADGTRPLPPIPPTGTVASYGV